MAGPVSRHASLRTIGTGGQPLRLPIRPRTALRLGLINDPMRWPPRGIIRMDKPVSDEVMRDLEQRFAARVPSYVFVQPFEPDPPMIVRSPPRPAPWWRGLMMRSAW